MLGGFRVSVGGRPTSPITEPSSNETNEVPHQNPDPANQFLREILLIREIALTQDNCHCASTFPDLLLPGSCVCFPSYAAICLQAGVWLVHLWANVCCRKQKVWLSHAPPPWCHCSPKGAAKLPLVEWNAQTLAITMETKVRGPYSRCFQVIGCPQNTRSD